MVFLNAIQVSVEDLHVIILIRFIRITQFSPRFSFSRRPACYNTDTENLAVRIRTLIVSVEDLHVIILIPINCDFVYVPFKVSVEDLHVIILIRAAVPTRCRIDNVSVEDLHVIILIL